jgi:hypothetical protein
MYEKCTGICKLTFIPVYPQLKFREWTLVHIYLACLQRLFNVHIHLRQGFLHDNACNHTRHSRAK